MNKLYVWCRRFHRLLAVLVLLLGLVMTITGLLMKYPQAAVTLLPAANLGLVRFLHNQFSTIFGITLGLMSLTGLVMFLYPTWIKKRN